MSFIALAFERYQLYLEPKDSVCEKNNLGKGEREATGYKWDAKICYLEFGENQPLLTEPIWRKSSIDQIKSSTRTIYLCVGKEEAAHSNNSRRLGSSCVLSAVIVTSRWLETFDLLPELSE
jgi:hypothetical protein